MEERKEPQYLYCISTEILELNNEILMFFMDKEF